MSDHYKHGLPDFLVQNLNEEKPMSGQERKDFETAWELSSGFSYPETNVNAQWNQFRSGLNVMEVSHKKKTFRYHMFRWAAAAVILIVSAIGIFQYRQGADPGFTQLYVSGATKMEIKLPDGSRIVLNKNSKLSVDAMNPYKRALTLHNGEAFFSVTHDGRPFIVSSAQGNVEVLGTEFDIKAYQGQAYSVYLKKGKIRWHNTEGSYDMKPGQELSVSSQKVNVQTADEQVNLAWCTGDLVFNEAKLSEIISVLESKYNVKLSYDNALAAETYTLTVSETFTLNQALELLTRSTNSKITVN